MKPAYKEDPKAWCKQVLLTVLGLAVITLLLCWRRHLTTRTGGEILAALALVAAGAIAKPAWFRGYYRLSMRLGFYSSQVIGFVALAFLFVFVVTPLGFVLRLAGKDPLQLRRPQNASSYWSPGKPFGPLDRLF